MIMPMAEPPAAVREMNHDDLSMVSDIERRSYEFPWSHGVFRDCLLAGYQNIVLVRDDRVAGYGVLSIAAGEAHVLNLCVDPEFRSHGYGEKLLDEMLFRARAASSLLTASARIPIALSPLAATSPRNPAIRRCIGLSEE